MRGSTNTSHQLHSAVAHWRNPSGGVSGLRLRRRTSDGRLVHLRTVFLDLTASPGQMAGTVRNASSEEIICDIEFESPGAALGTYEEDLWALDGLRCVPSLTLVSPDGEAEPARAVSLVQAPDRVWLRVPVPVGRVLRISLRFSLS